MPNTNYIPTILLYDNNELTVKLIEEILIKDKATGLELALDTATNYLEARELFRQKSMAQDNYDLVIAGCQKDGTKETSEGANVIALASIASQVIVLSGVLYFTVQKLMENGVPAEKMSLILSGSTSRHIERFLDEYDLTVGKAFVPDHINVLETPPKRDFLAKTVRQSLDYMRTQHK